MYLYAIILGLLICVQCDLRPNLKLIQLYTSATNVVHQLLLHEYYNTVHFQLNSPNVASEDLLSRIIHGLDCPVEINTHRCNENNALVMIIDSDSLNTVLIPTVVPSPVSYLVIIIIQVPGGLMENTPRILNKIMKIQSSKIAVITIDQSNYVENSAVNALIYTSYKTRNCATEDHIVLTSQDTKTTERKTTNFHQCSLDVGIAQLATFVMAKQNGCTWDYFGLEIQLVDQIAEHFNFSTRFVRPPDGIQWGDLHENSSSTGLMKMIQTGQVDLAIGSIATSLTRNTLLRAGTGNFFDKVIFALPPGIPYSPLEKLLMPASANVWILIMAACLVESMLISIDINEQFNQIIIGKLKSPLIVVWLTLLGGAMLNPPRATFARSILIGWMYGTLVIRTAYQAVLFGHLRRGEEFKPISSLADIDEAGLQFYMYNVSRRFFWRNPNILERSVVVDDNVSLHDVLSDIADNVLQAAFPLPQSNVAYFNKQRYVKSKAHISGYVIESYEVAIHYPPHSPLTALINGMVLGIRAAGLHQYWVRQFQGPNNDVTTEPIMLGIQNLEGAFIIHGIICACSCAVLIMELILAKFIHLLPRKKEIQKGRCWHQK